MAFAIWLLGVSAGFAQPAQVIIIRHAEKPDSGNGLSLKGMKRAAALVPYFLGTESLLKFGEPVAIYAQAQRHETSSIRPIETVRPLAKGAPARDQHVVRGRRFQEYGQGDHGFHGVSGQFGNCLLGAQSNPANRGGISARRTRRKNGAAKRMTGHGSLLLVQRTIQNSKIFRRN